MNCAALPGTLASGACFGYERSAFTDAKHAKPSLFEAASGDHLPGEVGNCRSSCRQAAQGGRSRTVRRLGAIRERPHLRVDPGASNVICCRGYGWPFRSTSTIGWPRSPSWSPAARSGETPCFSRHSRRVGRPPSPAAARAFSGSEARIAAAWPATSASCASRWSAPCCLPPEPRTLGRPSFRGPLPTPAPDTRAVPTCGGRAAISYSFPSRAGVRKPRAGDLSAALRRRKHVVAAARLLHMRRDAIATGSASTIAMTKVPRAMATYQLAKHPGEMTNVLRRSSQVAPLQRLRGIPDASNHPWGGGSGGIHLDRCDDCPGRHSDSRSLPRRSSTGCWPGRAEPKRGWPPRRVTAQTAYRVNEVIRKTFDDLGGMPLQASCASPPPPRKSEPVHLPLSQPWPAVVLLHCRRAIGPHPWPDILTIEEGRRDARTSAIRPLPAS